MCILLACFSLDAFPNQTRKIPFEKSMDYTTATSGKLKGELVPSTIIISCYYKYACPCPRNTTIWRLNEIWGSCPNVTIVDRLESIVRSPQTSPAPLCIYLFRFYYLSNLCHSNLQCFPYGELPNGGTDWGYLDPVSSWGWCDSVGLPACSAS